MTIPFSTWLKKNPCTTEELRKIMNILAACGTQDLYNSVGHAWIDSVNEDEKKRQRPTQVEPPLPDGPGGGSGPHGEFETRNREERNAGSFGPDMRPYTCERCGKSGWHKCERDYYTRSEIDAKLKDFVRFAEPTTLSHFSLDTIGTIDSIRIAE